jgi:hypothetical protein
MNDQFMSNQEINSVVKFSIKGFFALMIFLSFVCVKSSYAGNNMVAIRVMSQSILMKEEWSKKFARDEKWGSDLKNRVITNALLRSKSSDLANESIMNESVMEAMQEELFKMLDKGTMDLVQDAVQSRGISLKDVMSETTLLFVYNDGDPSVESKIMMMDIMTEIEKKLTETNSAITTTNTDSGAVAATSGINDATTSGTIGADAAITNAITQAASGASSTISDSDTKVQATVIIKFHNIRNS